MPDPDQPFICYGESFPIAGGPLAMDHNPFRQEKIMLKPKPSPRRRVAMDMDTALIDEQWQKLQEFLDGKLSEEDMETVEKICRGGGDAPEEKAASSASDAALETERGRLHDRHRAGHITDAKYAEGIRALNARRGSSSVAQDGRGLVTPLDKLDAEFPHMNRLKR